MNEDAEQFFKDNPDARYWYYSPGLRVPRRPDQQSDPWPEDAQATPRSPRQARARSGGSVHKMDTVTGCGCDRDDGWHLAKCRSLDMAVLAHRVDGINSLYAPLS